MGPSRNLLIVHTPGSEDISDWLTVKARIEQRAPDIEVRIATNGSPNSVTRRWQTTRPSLVFCTFRLVSYQPKGGTVYCGRRMSKIDQLERLARHGVAVLRTELLTRDLRCDPVLWGDYVVVKPVRGNSGLGVRLVPTGDLAARFAEITRDGAQAMIVQPYLEHSEDGCPVDQRGLTMFGKMLYLSRNWWKRPRQSLEQIAADPMGIIASNGQSDRARSICNDPEIIALCERAHSAFAEIPVLGIDVLRDATTGKFYVMEVNPGGSTWHLSSNVAKARLPLEHVRELYAQFDALERATELLIDKTRAEAS